MQIINSFAQSFALFSYRNAASLNIFLLTTSGAFVLFRAKYKSASPDIFFSVSFPLNQKHSFHFSLMISMNAWNNLNLFRRNTIYFQSSPVTDSNPVFFPTYVLPCDKIFREAIIQRSGLQAIFDLKFTGFPAKNSSPYQFFPAFFLICPSKGNRNFSLSRSNSLHRHDMFPLCTVPFHPKSERYGHVNYSRVRNIVRGQNLMLSCILRLQDH